LSSHVIEGSYNARQSKKMITMQMRDENVLNFTPPDRDVNHPHLGALAAVQQEGIMLDFDNLGRRMAVMCWYR
ncbi:MAG: hypothetical protein R2806_04345, partial [Saprospiraceae bacterium]